MEIRQLELFLAVMEYSSVTRAAEKKDLSPGAISLQLRGLAEELRTELFSRSGKRLVATPDAFRLAEHARTVIREIRQIEQEFENDPAKDARPFHFATGATTLIHRLGRPLRMLRKRYAETEIQVTVANTEEIVAGLLDRKFDLGLISLPVTDDHLTIRPLFEEELLVLRPSPVAVRGNAVGTLKPSDLANVPFLLYPQTSNMRSIINRFFQEIELTPQVTMEADDTDAIKRMVEAGFGHSILPQFALRGRAKFFHAYRVAGHRLVRTQALAMARSDYPRALTQSIANFLQSALAKD